MPTDKRTPLKEAPLHFPGQSLDRQIEDLWGLILQYGLYGIAIFFIFIAAWRQSLSTKPFNPLANFAIVAVIMAFCAYKIWRIYRDIQRLKLARDGELAVGQGLEDLRQIGCQVFHDVVGENFNLDHIVISTTGIYTIETKTLSKPLKGQTKILVDGEKVLVNGAPMERDALTQVRAQASWLKDLLKKSTGKEYPIRPVILFPGWYVEQRDKREIWALNPAGLKTFIANEKEKLPGEDVYLAAYHLARYIRSKDLSK